MSILFVVLLAAIALVLQKLSIEHCLDGLSVSTRVDKRCAECGESFELVTEIANSKRLPVLFLHITERVPMELSTQLEGTGVIRLENTFANSNNVSVLLQTTYLMPRQRVTRALTASLPRRGRYIMQDVMLEAGDFLGLKERSKPFPAYREIIILPPRVDMADFDSAFGNFLGDISVRRFILSDPILTAGFREYTGREPQRDISWPRSLRDGRLMVKQYDYTAELTATVILNIAGGQAEDIEYGYSVARCVCERLEAKRITYSFITNASIPSAAGNLSYIGDGLGSRHLNTIVEGLGAATYNCTFSLGRLFDLARSDRKESRGCILITPALDREEAARVRRFENETGQRVLILTVTGTEAS